jgi:probable rRNA maturation factor
MAQTLVRRTRVFRVTVTDAAGRPISARGLPRWLEAVAPARARGRVVIALVPDRLMRSLNRRFAGVDLVTDVLSFPAEPSVRQRRRTGPGLPGVLDLAPLGDIVIATGRAARQARKAGHGVQTEFRVLALHGLLHLLGYDHHNDRDTMARAERLLRRRGGLPEGLIERASS